MSKNSNIAGKKLSLDSVVNMPVAIVLLLTVALMFILFGSGKPEDKRPFLNILFIGDSYSTAYDMPTVIAQLAKDDPNLPYQVYAEVFNIDNNSSLADKWNASTATNWLDTRKWHYVVLQPHSLWATTEGRFFKEHSGIKLWASAIRESGAEPVFFMTWPRRPGSYWYKHPSYNLTNAEDMYKNIYKATDVLERKLDLMVVPIADHWMYASERYKGLDLYHKDGSNPSPEGAYLNALLFYKKLINKDLDSIRIHPGHIGPENYKAIMDIAKMDIPR